MRYAAISIGGLQPWEAEIYICVRERWWKRRKSRGRDGTRAGQMRRTMAGIRWKLTFLHAELTPPITPTCRDVLGLHEVSLFYGNGERRSELVVTLAPLLFANLHTTRSRRERGARWARAVPLTIALFMNSFSLRAFGVRRERSKDTEKRWRKELARVSDHISWKNI